MTDALRLPCCHVTVYMCVHACVYPVAACVHVHACVCVYPVVMCCVSQSEALHLQYEHSVIELDEVTTLLHSWLVRARLS